MPNLSEFESLLEVLYEDHLGKPMEGQLGEQPAPLPDIKHPAVNADRTIDWLKRTHDTPEKAQARILWNKQYSPAETYEGKPIYRMNHGLAHAIRTMAYVEPVIHYLKCWGNDSLKAFANQVDENDLKKLMLVAAFLSIARDSEIDFGTQPGAHNAYRQKAVACFRHYYDKKDELPDEIKSLFDLFKSPNELNAYLKALRVLGDDKDESNIHVVLNMCHKLDLYRCRESGTANASVDQYIRTHSQGNYGEGVSDLTTWAMGCIEATGNQVKAKSVGYDWGRYLPANSTPAYCIKSLATQPPPEFRDTHSDEANPLTAPFFFKSIRADSKDYWEDYIEWVTPSPLNCTPHKPLREASKKNFTVKMKRTTGGQLAWQVVERAQDKPMYTAAEKRGFAKHSSLSYAAPRCSYQPPVFGHTADRSERLVGIRLEEDDVLINRIMQYDMGTVYRPYDFESRAQAKAFLKDSLASGDYCDSLNQLVQNHRVFQHNEILGRVKKISAVVVFSDNLPSRILAQLRAKQYQARFNAQQQELGLSVPPGAAMPIAFYLPGDKKNHTAYDEKAQAADLEAAKNDPDCKTYLEKLEALRQAAPLPDPFITKYKIQPVHVLAAYGDLDGLDALLKQSPGLLNATDARGMTPAHYAAFNHHFKILEFLVAAGADLTVPNAADVRPYVKQNQRKCYFTDKKSINRIILKKLKGEVVSDQASRDVSLESIADLDALLPLLSPEEIKKIADKLPLIITSVQAFKALLEHLSLEQRTAVYVSIKSDFPRFITSGHDFGELLFWLSPDQAVALYEIFKPHFFKLIKSATDFSAVFGALPPDQAAALFQQFKPRFTTLITSGEHFRLVYNSLRSDQAAELFQQFKWRFPTFIKSAGDFNWLLRNFKPPEVASLFAVFQPHFPRIIQSGDDFAWVFGALPSEQAEALYEAFKPEFSRIIQSPHDLQMLMQVLTPEQGRSVCEELVGPQLTAMLKSADDFKALFSSYQTAGQHLILCQSLKADLCRTIQSANDFSSLVAYTGIEKTTAVYNALEEQLPRMIQSADDLVHVLKYLTAEQCRAVCTQIQPRLAEIIKIADPDGVKRVFLPGPGRLGRPRRDVTNLGDVLACLDEDQRMIVCEFVRPQLSCMIRSAAHFKAVIDGLIIPDRQAFFFDVLKADGLSWLHQAGQAASREIIQAVFLDAENPLLEKRGLERAFQAWLNNNEAERPESIDVDGLDAEKIMAFIFSDEHTEGQKASLPHEWRLKLGLMRMRANRDSVNPDKICDMLYTALIQWPMDANLTVAYKMLICIDALETCRPSATPQLFAPDC